MAWGAFVVSSLTPSPTPWASPFIIRSRFFHRLSAGRPAEDNRCGTGSRRGGPDPLQRRAGIIAPDSTRQPTSDMLRYSTRGEAVSNEFRTASALSVIGAAGAGGRRALSLARRSAGRSDRPPPPPALA